MQKLNTHDRPALAQLFSMLTGTRQNSGTGSTELLCDLLRRKGALILSDVNHSGGGFNAIVMFGSITAGVIDARRGRPLSASRQRTMQAKLVDMGLTHLMIVHDGATNCIPSVAGVLYWDAN